MALGNLGVALENICWRGYKKVEKKLFFSENAYTCSKDNACLNHSKIIIQQGRGTSKSVVALRILYLGVLNYTEIFIECLNKTCKYTLCIYIYNNKEKKI